MNDINEIKAIYDEHFTQVLAWVRKQPVNSPEDGERIFREAKSRLEEGARKLKAIQVELESRDLLKKVRGDFKTVIKAADYGARGKYGKVERIRETTERKVKGNG